MSTRDNVKSLRQQIQGVVDADWSHPAWWLLTWLTGFSETLGGPPAPESRAFYHRANGGPDSDTFMGRPRTPVSGSHGLAQWGATRARSALAAVDTLDTALPGQPLRVNLAWDGTWLETRPLGPGASGSVVFTARGLHYLTQVSPQSENSAADRDSLEQGLERLLDGGSCPAGFRRIRAGRPVPALLVISLDVHHHDAVRHTHRNAWTDQGGPWLGIGRTPELEVVTTCHLVVDGLGHALLTDRILPEGSGRAQSGAASGLSPARTLPTGVAWRFLPRGVGRFPEQAYATGLALVLCCQSV